MKAPIVPVLLGFLFSTTAVASSVCQLYSTPTTFDSATTIGTLSPVDIYCVNQGFSGAPIVNLNFQVFFNITGIFGSPTLTQDSNTYSGFFIQDVAYDPNQPVLNFLFEGVQVNPRAGGASFLYWETITLRDPTSQFFGPTFTLSEAHQQNPNAVLVGINAPVPEPASVFLAGAGAGLIVLSKLRHQVRKRG